MLKEQIRAAIFLIAIFLICRFEIKLLIDKLKKRKNRIPGFARLSIHVLAILGILCFAYGYFIEPYWIELKTVDIFTDKLKNTELKIIQISDLHCDKKIRNEYKLVKLINPLKPDIIVFTGDSLNTAKALPVFKDTMKRLKAGIGKYAVRGNFDVWYWEDLDLYSDTGFEVLDHNSIKLIKDDETFYITGLSYGEYPNRYYEVLENIPRGNFSIFLYHYPDLIEDLNNINIDLYLAGHVHGGQVALPIYGALVTLSKFGKKYERGECIVNNTILYVNRGIGMEGGVAPRVRFWSRPEITIFNIKPKKN